MWKEIFRFLFIERSYFTHFKVEACSWIVMCLQLLSNRRKSSFQTRAWNFGTEHFNLENDFCQKQRIILRSNPSPTISLCNNSFIAGLLTYDVRNEQMHDKVMSEIDFPCYRIKIWSAFIFGSTLSNSRFLSQVVSFTGFWTFLFACFFMLTARLWVRFSKRVRGCKLLRKYYKYGEKLKCFLSLDAALGSYEAVFPNWNTTSYFLEPCKRILTKLVDFGGVSRTLK